MTQEARRPRHPEPDQESLSKRFRLWLRASVIGRHPDASLKEAIEEVLEEHEEEGVEELRDEEQKMLKKVLNFGVLEVSDIMTPRSDIKAVECNIALADLKEHLIQNFHTRVPVYNDTLDNIKGFIHVKDLIPLFSGDSAFNMAFVLRDVLFVPPSMKLTDLLIKMRAESVHIAIVVDEYGGTDGLVTLEDIFEEIVGDIQDEHDEDEVLAHLVWNAEGFCDVDARVRVETLEQRLELSLHEEGEHANYDTLGGLIFYKLAHVPIDGEVIEYQDGVRFEIISADPRMIKLVRIYKKPEVTQGDVE